MTIQLIDPTLVDHNPFQPATRLEFSPADLADLESIRDIGFIQTPQARPLPSPVGEGPGVRSGVRYQLLFGHRRRAAWLLYRPGEPMPVDIVEADDQAMYERMAIENGQRQDLTPIEKAQLIKGHIDRYHSTQAAAGALVGLKTQSGVANLLRLLELPPEVQPLVGVSIPQRLARQLVRPAQIAPYQIADIAQAIADAPDDEKEQTTNTELNDLLRHKAIWIRNEFPTDWQPSMSVDIAGRPETPPACTACDFFIAGFCTRKACYAAKAKLWPQAELQRVSQQFSIPIAAPSEKAKPLVFDGKGESRVKSWLTAKQRPDHLRIMLKPDQLPYGYYEHRHLLGSPVVVLASLTPGVLNEKPAPKEKPASGETPAQRAKRIEREQREAEQRRAARSAARRARADVTWPTQQLTIDTAAQLKIEGGILAIAAHDISRNTNVLSDWPELLPFERSVHGDKDPALLKQHIVFKLLLAKIQTYKPAETFAWSRALKLAREVVEDNLKLKLLTGWDQPPVHHTDANCWQCGQFTPGPSITGVDRAAGWRVNQDGVVTCSEDCQKKYRPAGAPPAKTKQSPSSGGTKQSPSSGGTKAKRK